MGEIGLFPLDIVLLPSEHVPLHIFEPRYRELIAESLERSSEFGIVLAEDDGIRHIGTRAAILEVVETLPDGRSNIVVEGRSRFRVVKMTEGRSFVTAEVEDYTDEGDPAADEDVERCLEALERVMAEAGGEPSPFESQDGDLSFQIAARVDFGPQIRQELLEERSEGARLRRLADLLGRAAQVVQIQRMARERARGDGKVERL